MRPGSEIGQLIIGLSAHQALQLIERLQENAEHCRAAVAGGKGGNKFPDQAP
jgi:hypothetical protein